MCWGKMWEGANIDLGIKGVLLWARGHVRDDVGLFWAAVVGGIRNVLMLNEGSEQ